MELELNDRVINSIKTIDKVLNSYGEKGIFDNPEIDVNEEVLLDSYVQFYLKFNEYKVPLCFIIKNGDVRIDIDRTNELIEWVYGSDLKELKSLLKMVLESFVLVEYHGSKYTRLSFFNKKGINLESYTYKEGFCIKGNRTDRLYLPYF